MEVGGFWGSQGHCKGREIMLIYLVFSQWYKKIPVCFPLTDSILSLKYKIMYPKLKHDYLNFLHVSSKILKQKLSRNHGQCFKIQFYVHVLSQMLLSHFLEIAKMILIILLFNDLKNISALLYFDILVRLVLKIRPVWVCLS